MPAGHSRLQIRLHRTDFLLITPKFVLREPIAEARDLMGKGFSPDFRPPIGPASLLCRVGASPDGPTLLGIRF